MGSTYFLHTFNPAFVTDSDYMSVIYDDPELNKQVKEKTWFDPEFVSINYLACKHGDFANINVFSPWFDLNNLGEDDPEPVAEDDTMIIFSESAARAFLEYVADGMDKQHMTDFINAAMNNLAFHPTDSGGMMIDYASRSEQERDELRRKVATGEFIQFV